MTWADRIPPRQDESDTELHWMPGPPVPTPDWVRKGWEQADAHRRSLLEELVELDTSQG